MTRDKLMSLPVDAVVSRRRPGGGDAAAAVVEDCRVSSVGHPTMTRDVAHDLL